MNERWLRYVLCLTALFAAVNFLSCGNKLKLVSIDLQPGSAKFLTPDPNGLIVFTALGTYIHPPATRDITGRVTWTTDNPQLLVVTKGVVSPQPGNVCGVGDIYANFNDGGNLITAFATITVNDPTRPICPGGSTTQGAVSVTIAGPAGTAGGSVMSAPAGIACPPGLCIAQFTVGTTVGFNATPSSGHTFAGWTGCTPGGGNSCSLLVPTGNTSVTATFN